MFRLNDRYHRILIVDDNPSVHQDFDKVLSADTQPDDCDILAAELFGEPQQRPCRQPFQLDHALQGSDAVRRVEESIAERRPYAVAFVDVFMPPGMDGIETIEQLWKIDPHLVCVICTACSDPTLRELCARLQDKGHFLFLKKPFDPIEVEQLAQTLTTIRRLQTKARIKQKQLKRLVARRTAALQQLARTDPLTKLPNRASFLKALERCVSQHSDPSSVSAILFIDLDNFKLINDTLGHGVGDEVLSRMAGRLRAHVRSSDQVFSLGGSLPARLGGDEFAVLLKNLTGPDQAEQIAERLQTSLQAPLEVCGRTLHIGSSIGVAIIDRSVTDPIDVLRNADTAMYSAKRAGKNRVHRYHASMQEEALQQLNLDAGLRTALEKDQFELYLQPIIRLADNTLAGFETLLRWRGDDGRLRLPGEFIATTEENGLIIEIGRWVLEQACRIIADHRHQTGQRLTLSVNFSRRQLIEPGLLAEVEKVINHYGIDPKSLNFEITESTMIADGHIAFITLQKLKEMGIGIHLDDFGVGMSSLSSLRTFPVDAIKIDKCFISGREGLADVTLVEAILSIASAMELEVVAEGIENEEQLRFLTSIGCHYGQGYYLGRPQPVRKALNEYFPQPTVETGTNAAGVPAIPPLPIGATMPTSS